MKEFKLENGQGSDQGSAESPNGSGEEIVTPELLKDAVRIIGDRAFSDAVDRGWIAPVISKKVLINRNISRK